jgi:hypothetical protein
MQLKLGMAANQTPYFSRKVGTPSLWHMANISCGKLLSATKHNLNFYYNLIILKLKVACLPNKIINSTNSEAELLYGKVGEAELIPYLVLFFNGFLKKKRRSPPKHFDFFFPPAAFLATAIHVRINFSKHNLLLVFFSPCPTLDTLNFSCILAPFFKKKSRNEPGQNIFSSSDPFQSCQYGWHDS